MAEFTPARDEYAEMVAQAHLLLGDVVWLDPRIRDLAVTDPPVCGEVVWSSIDGDYVAVKYSAPVDGWPDRVYEMCVDPRLVALIAATTLPGHDTPFSGSIDAKETGT